jgi:hypothetical protein
LRTQFLIIALLASSVAHGAPLTDCTAKAEPTYSKVSRVVHNWLHPHHRVYPKPMMCGDPDLVTVEVRDTRLEDITITPPDTSLSVAYMGLGGTYGAAVVVTPWVELPVTEPAVWRDARDTITTEEHKPQCVPEPATYLVFGSGLFALYLMRRRYVRS